MFQIKVVLDNIFAIAVNYSSTMFQKFIYISFECLVGDSPEGLLRGCYNLCRTFKFLWPESSLDS